MISVVTFKWKPRDGYRSAFGSDHVNVLRNMVQRHYRKPHRFICVTDDPEGIDPGIEIAPLWDDHAHLANPTWPDGPSCYRRLKVFSREFGEIAGPRFVCLDLDMVITADVSPLWDRPEPFLIWHTGLATIPYCASMMLMDAGARPDIWEDFDPVKSPAAAKAARCRGSDQGWITYKVGRAAPGWSKRDGVYSYFELIPSRPPARLRGFRERQQYMRNGYGSPGRGPLPENSRVVIFTGKPDPWDEDARIMSPWIDKHYV